MPLKPTETPKKKKTLHKDNIYFNIQLVFTVIIILSSFLLKKSGENIFNYQTIRENKR